MQIPQDKRLQSFKFISHLQYLHNLHKPEYYKYACQVSQYLIVAVANLPGCVACVKRS